MKVDSNNSQIPNWGSDTHHTLKSQSQLHNTMRRSTNHYTQLRSGRPYSEEEEELDQLNHHTYTRA